MHLSTSSFSSYRRAVAITLLWAIVFIVGLEVVTRLGFARVSRIESRIQQEHTEALALRPAPHGQPPTILIVGNSLLLNAIDQSFATHMAPYAHVQRFVIESTSILDWEYGVRRLFAEGARPDYFIVCLGPTHWVSDAIRGDYSSYYLFQTRDIPAVGREVGLSLTEESSLLAARYSLFYAGRACIRNFILNRSYPSYGELLSRLTTHPAALFPLDQVEAKVERRLRQLIESTHQQSRLIMLVPPTFYDYQTGMRAAAQKMNVPLLVPIPANELPSSMFTDSFHVNELGAQKFMALLEPQLRALIAADSLGSSK